MAETASQEALSPDPLLAIFGSGRLTDSTGSQLSQDNELPLSQPITCKEPKPSNQCTTGKLPDQSKAGMNSATTKSNAVGHSATRSNAIGRSTTRSNAMRHSTNQDDPVATRLDAVGCSQNQYDPGTAVGCSSSEDVESHNGSRDLFSSQPTQGSLIDKHIDITLQCDNPDCQKWRRIPASEVEDVGDDPWYCQMSSDPDRNTCTAPEEDHAVYDRIAKKAGIKFVMSMLSVGSLVWAKMAGYCRWPALITRDPVAGCHVLMDIDGDPYSYHVEFLGKSHSHSWVAAKFIEVYGHKARPELDDSQSQSQKRGRGCIKGRAKKAILSSQSAGKIRRSYKRMHIDAVMQEADFLLGLEQDERLKYSIFTYDAYKQQKAEGKKESQTSCDKCSQCKKKGNKRKDIFQMKEKMEVPNDQVLDSLKETINVRRESQSGGRKKMKMGKENRTVYDYTSDGATASNYEISLDEGISGTVKTVKTEVSVFDSPDQFSQSRLKFMNPMMDKSKEEKFSIDIDMYRKNEAAFEHDVRRFMSRNGQSIRNTPVWHTVPVRLFQLYIAVHERGGFQQVNKKKQWSAVYKELTEQQHVSCGAVAKKYYQKNLYPYELYITGREYESALREQKKQTSKVQKKKTCPTPVPTGRKMKSDGSHVLQKDDGTTLSQDIEAILDRLEEDYSMEAQHTGQQTEKAGIKFHDDNTQSSQAAHKVPSEFQPSTKGDVQEVPDGSFSGDGLSDIEEKILHEMKALEDDINEIGDLD